MTRPKMLNIATIISALFCLATAALWVRSYWITDFVCYERFDTPYATISQSAIGDATPMYSGMGTRYAPLAIYCTELVSQPGRISLIAHEQITPHASGGFYYTSYTANNNSGGLGGNIVYWDRLGFLFVTCHWNGKRFGWEFGIPYWFIVTICLIAPVRWISTRHHRRQVPGHCRSCGYDLRATPTRCPECGLEVQ